MDTKEKIETAGTVAFFAWVFAVLLAVVAVLDAWNFPGHNYFGLFFVAGLTCAATTLYAGQAKRKWSRLLTRDF